MQTLSTGGLNCFCSKSSGPVAFSRTASIPTPSIKELAGLVRRSADSQVRVLPLGSV